MILGVSQVPQKKLDKSQSRRSNGWSARLLSSSSSSTSPFSSSWTSAASCQNHSWHQLWTWPVKSWTVHDARMITDHHISTFNINQLCISLSIWKPQKPMVFPFWFPVVTSKPRWSQWSTEHLDLIQNAIEFLFGLRHSNPESILQSQTHHLQVLPKNINLIHKSSINYIYYMYINLMQNSMHKFAIKIIKTLW